MSRLRLSSFVIALFLLPSALHAQSETVKPAPREGKWADRHALINSRAKEGKKDLIFLGDSITQAWEGPGKVVWEKYYAPRNAMNAGISGDRTQHVLWRLDNGNIEGLSPKVAVLMIGTNNSGNNTSEEIAAGIKAIVEKLRMKSPKTKVLILAIFPRGATKDDPRRKVTQGANEIVKKLADGEMVHYLDIGPKFLQADGTLSTEIMPDLLHLNEKSYAIWAESIEPLLAELMQ